jgi:hypothetical protein
VKLSSLPPAARREETAFQFFYPPLYLEKLPGGDCMKRGKLLRPVLLITMLLLLASPAIATAQPASAPTVGPGGWQPFPNPATASLNAVALASTVDGWAVGDAGTSLHWNGTAWTAVPTPVTFDLNWVDSVPGGTVGSGEAWAGGVSSTEVLHYVGTSWVTVTIAAPGQIDAVWMNSATDGWMVGDHGGTLRYTGGTTWTAVDSGVTVQLHDVESNPSDPADTWAVGEGGTILHWNGTAWVSTPASGITTALYNVAVLASNNVWVVGSSDGTQSVILHWNGTSWTQVTAPVNTTLWDVWFVSPTNGWATGNGGDILHWDGSSWTQWTQTTPVPAVPLYAIQMVGPLDGWIVGNVTAGNAAMLRFSAPYQVALPLLFKQ